MVTRPKSRYLARSIRCQVFTSPNSLSMALLMSMGPPGGVPRPLHGGAPAAGGALSGALAEALRLPREKVEDVCLAVLLHDIGKAAVPAEILLRPGPLSPWKSA